MSTERPKINILQGSGTEWSVLWDSAHRTCGEDKT